MKPILLFLLLFSAAWPLAYAMPPFVGDDFSGEYACKGSNDSVGEYEVRVTLQLNKATSHDIYGIYDFNTETNKQAIYAGQIMAKGRRFAMTFKLLNLDKIITSTGMGDFKKADRHRWRFQSTYYEPDGNGGNFGSDTCTMTAKQKTKEEMTRNSDKPSKHPS